MCRLAKGVAVEGVVGLVDALVLVGFLVCVPVCCLKGRPGIGWFGLFMFVSGAALSFPVYRLYRDGWVSDWWRLLWALQGLVVVLLLGSVARRPARSGSWWAQRNDREAPARLA